VLEVVVVLEAVAVVFEVVVAVTVAVTPENLVKEQE
jgi:hypothetical protein